MATHSSILAWKSPWTEEPGGLQSMGLHDWACMHEGGGRRVSSNKLVELKKKKHKRRLLLGGKALANLDHIFKSRTINLHQSANKGSYIVEAVVFPVVMHGCESWTVKKAEHRRIDAFELWCWRRLFESPLDCKEIKPVNLKGNQSWIGRTDAEVEAPVFGHIMQRVSYWKRPWWWERLRAGGEGDDRIR